MHSNRSRGRLARPGRLWRGGEDPAQEVVVEQAFDAGGGARPVAEPMAHAGGSLPPAVHAKMEGESAMGPLPEYDRLDATELADLVRRKQIRPVELVDAAIERIEAANPRLNAVIFKLYDRGRQQAAGPLPDGPFSRVPFLLKDLLAAGAG